MENTKQDRVLEIFFRGLRGEDLSVQKLASEYEVSTKSITRSINDLKAFLADHRQLVGGTELQYSHQDKCYRLYMDEFLSSKELFSVVEVLIGARAFSKEELTEKLEGLMDESKYGFVLRAKGIVAGIDGNWIHFDYVPGEADVRNGAAEITGRLCVIGSKLNKERIAELFE